MAKNCIAVSGARRAPWAKWDQHTGNTHHLAHHSADVAATFLELMSQHVFRKRASAAVGHDLTEGEIRCLAALVFLHDIGKLAPAFQAKAWPEGEWSPGLRDHLECGWIWGETCTEDTLAGAGAALFAWPDMPAWFHALFAHHGKPVDTAAPGQRRQVFQATSHYDWKEAETIMGEALQEWFPEIHEFRPPEPTPALMHWFTGMLALADWIGSDTRAFGYVPKFDPTYWRDCREKARARLHQIGLDTRQRPLSAEPDWSLISHHASPNPAQREIGQAPASSQLAILEAETGSGKTEAALWRFAVLYAAGEVESLYFAVPTRAAARQLHGRINEALQRMFADAPEAVLAIPGMMLSGEAEGTKMPGFSVRWDDDGGKPGARWACEHATRYLAAQIAVGTVDQAMMAALQTKHAHMRGSALSRSLLVIDEVHASDAYMTQIQEQLLTPHLEIGGHALLMSATLGSVARARWMGTETPSYEEALAAPYPAVWLSGETGPRSVHGAGRQKTVRVQSSADWSPEAVAERAIEAAEQGAKVLVIRNTVVFAQETFKVIARLAPHLLMDIDGEPALHHSRYAAEDRARLDARVESLLGDERPNEGCIVIGTQTLEQSLDIDADFMISDLCPMDVLLQRVGRLHRHDRDRRAAGFQDAQLVVVTPAEGMDVLTHSSENGLGSFPSNDVLSGVYVDVPMLQATLDQVEQHDAWHIPEMNRELVEAATHPEALDEVARQRDWEGYRNRVNYKDIAESMAADLCILRRDQPLPRVYSDDIDPKTRLGEAGLIFELPEPMTGPFGTNIQRVALPAHWSEWMTGEEEVSAVRDRGCIRINIGRHTFFYAEEGLTKAA